MGHRPFVLEGVKAYRSAVNEVQHRILAMAVDFTSLQDIFRENTFPST